MECNPDEILVKALGIPRKEIDHAGNKEEVCKELEICTNSKGLVDEDPLGTQPSYIKKLKPLSDKRDDIKLMHDKKARNYLIILCPRLEEWILKATREAGVNVEVYGLPNNADELHKFINTKLKGFVNLIENIKGKSRMLKTLEDFLKRKKFK
ncbi:MAG: hypothetical protein ACREOW_09000 [Thermodesulfobacteriota bacterium]